MLRQTEPPDIRERTLDFAARVVKLCGVIEGQSKASSVLASQLLRSGTSVGANVEEAFGGASNKDFSNKVSIASKEARESHYWLRLLARSELMPAGDLADLIDEANQIVAILTSIRAKTMDRPKTSPL